MEKFSFLKFVKISFLVLGLSSLVFTSCKSDDDDPKDQNNFTDIDVPGQVLNLDGIHIVYPENHTFGVWNQGTKEIKNLKFDYFLTMDTLSKNVRIHYFLLSDSSYLRTVLRFRLYVPQSQQLNHYVIPTLGNIADPASGMFHLVGCLIVHPAWMLHSRKPLRVRPAMNFPVQECRS